MTAEEERLRALRSTVSLSPADEVGLAAARRLDPATLTRRRWRRSALVPAAAAATFGAVALVGLAQTLVHRHAPGPSSATIQSPNNPVTSSSTGAGCPRPAIRSEAQLAAEPSPTSLPAGALTLPPPPDTYPEWTGGNGGAFINLNDVQPSQLLIHLANHSDSPVRWSYDLFVESTGARNRRYPGGVAVGSQPIQYQDIDGGIWDWMLSHCRNGQFPATVVPPHSRVITALDLPTAADHVMGLSPGKFTAQLQLYRDGRPDAEAAALLTVVGN